MPFVTYDAKEGKTAQDDKFIKMMETITRLCKNNVMQNQATIKKNGRKRIDTESLCLLKTKDDSDKNNKYAPAMFVKILTKCGTKPVEIETPSQAAR